MQCKARLWNVLRVWRGWIWTPLHPGAGEIYCSRSVFLSVTFLPHRMLVRINEGDAWETLIRVHSASWAGNIMTVGPSEQQQSKASLSKHEPRPRGRKIAATPPAQTEWSWGGDTQAGLEWDVPSSAWQELRRVHYLSVLIRLVKPFWRAFGKNPSKMVTFSPGVPTIRNLFSANAPAYTRWMSSCVLYSIAHNDKNINLTYWLWVVGKWWHLPTVAHSAVSQKEWGWSLYLDM